MSLAKARELAVLSLLRAHPAHGYDIARALAEGPLALLGISRPAVYAILDRFAERGWVTGHTERAGRHPDRTVLHLTPGGEAALAARRDDVEHAAAPAVVPLMALMLAADSGDRPAPDRIAALLDSRRARLAALEADTDHADSASSRLAHGILAAEIAALARLE